MRLLNHKEREYLLAILKDKTKTINAVMFGFKLFGLFQIGLAIYGMLFGSLSKEDFPGIVFLCVIIYLAYFKLAGFLAKQNQWKCLLEAVNKEKTSVCECKLLHTYETTSGDGKGASVFMAVLSMNEKEVRCNADRKLQEIMPGTQVALVCSNTSFETSSFVYAMEILQ